MPKPLHNPTICRSVNEFLTAVREIDDDTSSPQILYRGQSSSDPLVPSIARPYIDKVSFRKVVIEREKRSFAEFCRQAVAFKGFPKNVFDRLAYAQHVGLPTRLLDWTENPQAAVFFAASSDAPRDLKREGVLIWRLASEEEDLLPDNQKINGKTVDPFSPPRTLLYKPNFVHDRIKAQSAWFSLHKITPEMAIPLEVNNRYRKHLRLFVILDSIERIRSHLHGLGANRAFYYPDPFNVAKHVDWLVKKQVPYVVPSFFDFAKKMPKK